MNALLHVMNQLLSRLEKALECIVVLAVAALVIDGPSLALVGATTESVTV